MIIRSGPATIAIDADNDIETRIAESRFLKAHIPLSEVVSMGSCMETADAGLTLRTGGFSAAIGYPRANYTNPVVDHRDAIALSGYMLERARHERGVYSVHSNTVDIRGEGVVVYGPSHAGKTLLSALLAQACAGRIIANERSLVTPEQGVVQGSLDEFELGSYAAGVAGYSAVPPSLLGGSAVPISFFVRPHHSSRPGVTRLDPRSALWDVMEQTDIFIRGINRTVRRGMDGEYPLPSLDTDELAQRRRDGFRSMLEGIPCYSVAGSHDQMVGQIADLLRDHRKDI